MCGITGIWSWRDGRIDPGAHIGAMTESLHHRGPDSSGIWRDQRARLALGHRRLAIIDLSAAGHQPMVSADGRWVISYNGEIYNYRVLRARLEVEGAHLRGESDTEVILEGCARWGVEATLSEMVGMFAIALWDRERLELRLIRDRLGIKPLYWADLGGALLFGSELVALRACRQWKAEVDHQSVASFMRHGYVPSPHSIYRNVAKLAPGTMLTVAADGVARRSLYWNLPEIARAGIAQPHTDNIGEIREEMEALLRDAVGIRMIADVPLGAFLSGGIDSSAVVALMQAQSMHRVRTFSIGFNVPGYDEAHHARAVSRHLGTDHTELYVEPQDALSVIPRLADVYDEPFADSSQIPTYLISAMARKHVTVALTGDGGDELFAGYNRYRYSVTVSKYLAAIPTPLRALAAAALRALPPASYDAIARVLPERLRLPQAGDKIHKAASLLTVPAQEIYLHLISQWKDPAQLVMAPEYRGILWDTAIKESVGDGVAAMQLQDMLTYLPDDILTKVDRASMAVSLEARVPLLDHRVVAAAWRLPLRAKLRGATSKVVLREILYRHVPASLMERPKMGFGVPINAWLRGPLREWAEDLLSAESLGADGMLDPQPVRRLWCEHLHGRRNWQYALWNVLMYQAWRRRWS